MPTNVEAAGHVVERNRTYACDEDTVKWPLELLKNVAIEAFGMVNAPIHVLILLVEHGVGKVVYLIDDEVERVLVLFRFIIDEGKFVNPVAALLTFLTKSSV